VFDELPFKRVWALDFEFQHEEGERVRPWCLVARDLKSGHEIRQWHTDFRPLPPYDIGEDDLVVCYSAIAEMSCHRVLGWPMPARLLDLYVEFKRHTNGMVPRVGSGHTNGMVPRVGSGLLHALQYYGLSSIEAAEKDSMRELAIRGAPFTAQERAGLVDYCATDVDALQVLLAPMMRALDLPRALYRGRYMEAASAVEHNGVPIDMPTLDVLREHWDGIKELLIADVDRDYGVFEGTIFKQAKFEAWVLSNGLPWPRTPTGRLALDEETLKEMSKSYPQEVSPLRELLNSLGRLRLAALTVGKDGRNRYALFPFSSSTGRNQPSSNKAIFGNAVWLRGLIKPPEGHALAYIDWSQQEFGIAAALSGDANMLEAYNSGDPYLKFGQLAGAIPEDANKSHPLRGLFKQCVLAVQYGMGVEALAYRIGRADSIARDLLRKHHQTFAPFWKWNDDVESHAMLTRQLSTMFGWTERLCGADANPRHIRNFQMQAGGAEMMRLACCLGVERGIEICAPVHDAFLICAPLNRIDEAVAEMQACMLKHPGWCSTDSSYAATPRSYAIPIGSWTKSEGEACGSGSCGGWDWTVPPLVLAKMSSYGRTSSPVLILSLLLLLQIKSVGI
jgi:hypothetical protein